MFDLIPKGFPEIDINMDDVIVYDTNIFELFSDVTAEHDENRENLDVDLTCVASKKKNIDRFYSKRDFTNILLMFDYERMTRHLHGT